MRARLLLLLCSPPFLCAAAPNIVFLVCESTDGRTYRDGFAPALELPHIRRLAARGVQFDTHYADVPVCCPSRASFWSGRLPHKIPHTQKGTGLAVEGVWNNHEGLDATYADKIGDVLARHGYDVRISGKEDWEAGGHTENVFLDAWTMYTQFPYDINATGGWQEETTCNEDATVTDDQDVERHADWKALHGTVGWIKERAAAQAEAEGVAVRPWFAFQGMEIVHPPYVTNRYWLGKIDQEKVTVPEWAPLAALHPCDLQAAMLKTCTPSNDAAEAFYSASRRRLIRSVYYAMIAEFDAMVGRYVDAVDAAGAAGRTVFIVTADHGDMNMEHQQFYKMVQYDASARVPLIIAPPVAAAASPPPPPRVVTNATSLVDMFPTILDFAGVPDAAWPAALDGASLVPMVTGGAAARSPYAVSQFHGDDIGMSWFLITDGVWKYVVFGTGAEVQPQLFHLTADPDEVTNLLARALPDGAHLAKAGELDAALRAVVDYPSVARDVARYNHASFALWQRATPDWRAQLASKSLRWAHSFNVNATASFAALDAWQQEPPHVKGCRSTLQWPPRNP
eukprot:TRINITY_DN10199_c0_g1_i1.p2 TRINITY_DN10199_c0_g1~~TRINITY_DN10199_c0_g1_i1.p2  ORF type:complete len:567 (+),score=207.46 TRINITY_DN10199_c0_g1_i1:64-1764(+)